MREIENKLTSSKSTKNSSKIKAKSFGYQILGFGSGGAGASPFIAATGGTITTSGNFKIHTFNSDGTFCVSNAGKPGGSTTVSYMVIAGGGVGGGDSKAGGGGAGGYREGVASSDCYSASPANAGSGRPVSVQGYSITVGGSAANSVFSDITSTRGGEGGNNHSGIGNGQPGGSGGGLCKVGPGGTSAHGNGNDPPVSPSQGNPGGVFPGSPPTVNANSNFGTGGGGAQQAGFGYTGNSTGSGGGNGPASSITASPVTRGGGGAGSYSSSPAGPGGGGATNGGNGTANTGGGGGSRGQSGSGPGSGGSGVVIIRYKFQ